MAPTDRITIDEFTNLGPAEHAVAIHTYSQRITQLEKHLAQPGSEEARDTRLDELGRCLSLRKVHVLALAEQLQVVPPSVAA